MILRARNGAVEDMGTSFWQWGDRQREGGLKSREPGAQGMLRSFSAGRGQGSELQW